MSARSSGEREIRELAIAANSGEATEEQIARLDELVREDLYFASYAARVFDQQATLAWRGMTDERVESSGEATSRDSSVGAAYRISNPPTSADATVTSATSKVRGNEVRTSARQMRAWKRSWAWPTVAVGIAFVLGAVVASVLRPAGDSAPGSNLALLGPAQPTYEARLIRSTACLWEGDSADSREIGSGLSSGESLHLLEGLAEFNLDWTRGGSATLTLEGPAGMMLTSEGMPTLRFGRLTATMSASSRPFVLDTPVGRLIVAEFGSIGASVFGNDGEIHVFDGSAMLEPAWRTSTGQENVPLKIEAGEAIRVQEGAGGELSITRHSADEEYFVAQLSMTSDALLIPPSYVAAVKKSHPIGYWRFERDTWPSVPNQIGDRYECLVGGALGTAVYQGNQAVEFGVTDQGGEILCKDLLEGEIDDSYSIEFWIKPSHYHVGAVISLVGDPVTPSSVVPHGMLLEMGGTGLIPKAVHHPGRVRFLHRSPASNESETGTSCYSSEAYTLRKWQHIVAVKDGSQKRLYINGQWVGEDEDLTNLPADMRLLVGRLYPSRRVRPFIGQLDELAIYGRALTPEEIERHYRLVRPKTVSEPNI